MHVQCTLYIFKLYSVYMFFFHHRTARLYSDRWIQRAHWTTFCYFSFYLYYNLYLRRSRLLTVVCHIHRCVIQCRCISLGALICVMNFWCLLKDVFWILYSNNISLSHTVDWQCLAQWYTMDCTVQFLLLNTLWYILNSLRFWYKTVLAN